MDFLAGHGAGAKRWPSPPPRGGIPSPAPRTRCCPGSKSAAGRPGHCAGKEEGREGPWRGFLQGPKGLVMHGRLRARGPEEFSSPGPQGGRPGDAAGKQWEQRADRLQVTDN